MEWGCSRGSPLPFSLPSPSAPQRCHRLGTPLPPPGESPPPPQYPPPSQAVAPAGPLARGTYPGGPHGAGLRARVPAPARGGLGPGGCPRGAGGRSGPEPLRRGLLSTARLLGPSAARLARVPRERLLGPRSCGARTGLSLPPEAWLCSPQGTAEAGTPPGAAPRIPSCLSFPFCLPKAMGRGWGRRWRGGSPLGTGVQGGGALRWGEVGRGSSVQIRSEGHRVGMGVRRVPGGPLRGSAEPPQLCLPPPQRPLPCFQFSNGANGMGPVSLAATPRASVSPGHGHSLS